MNLSQDFNFSDPETQGKLDRIELALAQLNLKMETIMAELDDLKAAVARNTSVEQSAVVLLQGLKAKLDAAIAAGDPAALAALSASLGAADDDLAAAVVANTPAGP